MKTLVLQNTPQEALLTLAKFVKTVRLTQEMTLEELAARVGVSRSTLIRFEKNGMGSTETQVKIFAALGALDLLMSAFLPPKKQLSIAELKISNAGHLRQRGRRKSSGIS